MIIFILGKLFKVSENLTVGLNYINENNVVSILEE